MAKTIDAIKAEIQKDIDEIIASFEKYKKDGFRVSEVALFAFEAGTTLVEAVEKVKDITGPEKKQVVVLSVKDIYKKVNPDIPWIPEPFETMLENILLEQALDKFIDVIVAKYKEKGIFK